MSHDAPQALPISRRHVLCGGAASVFSALLASLLDGTRPVRAEAISGSVPEVDFLAVRVVTDSYQFAVAPSRTAGSVEIQHFGWGIEGDRPPGRTLISEFGLSLHIESRRGTQTRNVLVDFGFTPEALVNNTDLLGINAGVLDALVLSHGHYDHFGGLVGFLHRHKGKLTVTYTEGPSLVADHGFTTGQIALQSFEKVLSPTTMKPGVSHGVGCYADKLPQDERSKTVVPDQFQHEIATVFNLKDRGLVVLTSCSHRGVINTIKQAQAASGVKKVHAVIGGFHLAPYKEDYVQETVASLKEIDVDYVVPLHCTGEPFQDIAKTQMPNKLLRSYTGTRLVFGA